MPKFYLLIPLILLQCNTGSGNMRYKQKADTRQPILHENENELRLRFSPPVGFTELLSDTDSYSGFLQNLKLKPSGSKVFLYNGEEKLNQSVHASVVDMDIGASDLQQCADAAMRMRAEFLFKEKKYEDIHFRFSNGFDCAYSEWRKGKRLKFSGENCSWISSGAPSDSYESFRKYLDLVFNYAGSFSLSKELLPVGMSEMKIGDMFIHGGTPGHVVIVVNMAANAKGEKVFMLAQSFMPAQQIEILVNENDESISPWYALSESAELQTPQFIFSNTELMRWN